MHSKFTSAAAGALLWLGAAGGASAMLVTTDAGFVAPKVITFDAFDGLVTTGPVEVGLAEIGAPVTFTSTPFAELGANARDLGNNGLWGARDLGPTPTGSGNFLASLFATPQGAFTFTLATPVAGVGAFFNQFQGTVPNSFALIAYDAQGNTLETYSVSVDTDPFGYNEGSFFGIHRRSADIHGFGVANGAMVLDNLTFTATPVPEPGSYALMLAGLGVMGWLARRARPRP